MSLSSTTGSADDPDAARVAELRLRLRSFRLVKMVGTPAGIGAFFVAYFWVLDHPLFPVFVMPLTAIDRAIGFRPETLPVYLSLWVYVSIAPALVKTGRDLLVYALAAFALSATGLAIFILWPTTVPVTGIDWAMHSSVAFLKTVDAAANACPSLHVAFAAFTALWLDRILRELRAPALLRPLNAFWCVAIAWSTIAIRQHVFLDVLAGAVMGTAFGLVSLRMARPAQASRRLQVNPAADS